MTVDITVDMTEHCAQVFTLSRPIRDCGRLLVSRPPQSTAVPQQHLSQLSILRHHPQQRPPHHSTTAPQHHSNHNTTPSRIIQPRLQTPVFKYWLRWRR